MGIGSNSRNGLVWFLTHPNSQPAASLQARPEPVPVDLLILRGMARADGSNLQFWFLGFLFMVAFRYPTANRKILTLVRHCPFWVY